MAEEKSSQEFSSAVENSQESQDSISRSSSIFKFGTPIVNQLVSTRDLFEIVGARKRMDKSEYSKMTRETFLEKALKEGGDIHYFKVQTFGPSYKREVNL